jgi:hypothetical protein
MIIIYFMKQRNRIIYSAAYIRILYTHNGRKEFDHSPFIRWSNEITNKKLSVATLLNYDQKIGRT